MYKNSGIHEVEKRVNKMERNLSASEFNHMINLRSLIRDHHVYRNILNPSLAARPHDWEQALEHNKYAISIYKKKKNDCDELAGHATAEILSLLYHFLWASDDNFSLCKVVWQILILILIANKKGFITQN